MTYLNRYQLSRNLTIIKPNVWDMIVLTIVFGILAALAWGTSQMTSPYKIGDAIVISLDPKVLPGYAVSTVLRMFIALFFSLLTTFALAPLAAKNRHAERFLLPFIDIMQSLPVLGILSITVVGFIHLFPNSLLGPECAAIFAIFTSQVWNMILSLYQSLRTVPADLKEAAKIYHLSAWQRFWRIELPFGTPSLLWNAMISMSAGWFFVVLCEAISVANQEITLPGVGSYISKAIAESNLSAIGYAIITMFIVILIYDQLLFRPLLAWIEKFKDEIDAEETYQESWFFNLLAKTKLLKLTENGFSWLIDKLINIPKFNIKFITINRNLHPKVKILGALPENINFNYFAAIFWNSLLGIVLIVGTWFLINFIYQTISYEEIMHVLLLGLITAAKVFLLIIIASLIWVPIGVWIGLHPRASQFFQPLIQFLAAFPANLFYPIAVFIIVKYDLNQNIWTMPLMILGTQWYILFNVIAGSGNIPKEIRLVVKNFGVKGRLWWQRLMLPAIFPYYATGAMAAAGGCWNASIVAEFVQWGDHTIISTGLGSYITEFTRIGDFPRIALGIAIMALYVMLINRLLWQHMYNLAESRFNISATEGN